MPHPSERTIETLSNHGLLEVLNFGTAVPPFAWLIVPTQVQEALLGYDAGLQGCKRLLIQYKAINATGTFTFNFRQLWLLGHLNPRYRTPYVFAAANYAPDYPTLATDHAMGSRYQAFDRTFFLDVWLLIDELLRVVNGAAFVPPVALPPPPAGDLGVVTLKPVGAAFNATVRAASTLAGALNALSVALGMSGGGFGTKVGMAPEGCGEAFALSVAACHYGKPVAAFANEQYAGEQQDAFFADVGRITVLTVPLNPPV